MHLLRIKNLYETIIKKPEIIKMWNNNVNDLTIVEKNETERCILAERSFCDEEGKRIISGFLLMKIIDNICKEKDLIKFRRALERVVKERCGGNYMEVEPILIAKDFEEKVMKFVTNYNKLQRRKPIQLIKNIK
ncbi:hypothetical protein J7J39_00215 [bacterium]|nr:hypothetical protein [bacterium]